MPWGYNSEQDWKGPCPPRTCISNFVSLNFYHVYHTHLQFWITTISCFLVFILEIQGFVGGSMFSLPQSFVWISAGCSLWLSDASLHPTCTGWFLGVTSPVGFLTSALRMVFTHFNPLVVFLRKPLVNSDLDSDLGMWNEVLELDKSQGFSLLYVILWFRACSPIQQRWMHQTWYVHVSSFSGLNDIHVHALLIF